MNIKCYNGMLNSLSLKKSSIRFYGNSPEKKENAKSNLRIQIIPAGPLSVNCCIINDEKSKEALIVDPGGDFEILKNIIEKSNFELKSILLTHAHFDHVGAVGQLKKHFNCKIYLHEEDMYLWNNQMEQIGAFDLPYKREEELPDKPDSFLKEDDEIMLNGKSIARVIHTPGHSKGSVSFYFPKEKVAIVGDTLFKESIGRSDLWGGDGTVLRTAIRDKIYPLGDDTCIIPGHGPTTNVAYEKVENLNVF
ncbi:Metallo-hydrolase/oxidoreductase [Neocallimastix californiae]|jgi:glyoxylase-like metal-dependent hydrolase (beta-lactamase superfamily II)|uniref:Metallo-hydrolase/oxidoreductase n=1 Tax=Neocallimastix californiae TaxID=1754190 RepID=A0A1Y2FGP8_9FUNG|nr:Metallo-hydrolase/oxidoreductase [Neocallimastix californiae]|eukprot:ORY82787.1 Metallo-hydrolase/oxidoreductase [Neocallimastix californiae]